MLFQNYDFPEGMLSVDSDQQEVERKTDLLISESSRENLGKNLREAAEIQKQAAIRIWDEVFVSLNQTGM